MQAKLIGTDGGYTRASIIDALNNNGIEPKQNLTLAICTSAMLELIRWSAHPIPDDYKPTSPQLVPIQKGIAWEVLIDDELPYGVIKVHD